MLNYFFRSKQQLHEYYWRFVEIVKSFVIIFVMKWASTWENLSSGVWNNTGTDQPAHPRSLISAFVIHFSESIICKLATGEIPIF